MLPYPKRLIEVDLPIKRISAHARREKSIRHGHISTLHIWWARRPLAACRAVLCASLWIDPADELCPQEFRDIAAKLITDFAKKAVTEKALMEHCSEENWMKWKALSKQNLDTRKESHLNILRNALLDFIADFANWDNSTTKEYLETARALTQAAHEALGGEPGTRPLVVDPFAGGGSIPLEALRVGADAFASDLNPVAVLLNKVVLEYIPKYGQRLADEVRKWGQWIKDEAEKELGKFYPKDDDGATPIAYLWARTIRCEGPKCGAEVPLMRSLWLAKKSNRSIALQFIPDKKHKRVDFEIIEKRGKQWVKQTDHKSYISQPSFDGTVQRGSTTCPVCGYTTPVASVRTQLKKRRGGAADARLFCVVTTKPDTQGRYYRLPTQRDLKAVHAAAVELERRKKEHKGELSLVPDEPLPPQGTLGFRVQLYGMEEWGDLFTLRQSLALTTLVRFGKKAGDELMDTQEKGFIEAVQVCLSLAIDRQADYLTSLTVWASTGEFIAHTFNRQALPIAWDWPECQLFASGSGNWEGAIEWIALVIEALFMNAHSSIVLERNSATSQSMPDDAAHCFFTDPPYYDAVPYADLSDFFYVWLKRSVPSTITWFDDLLSPKSDECIVDEVKGKDRSYFERTMMLAMEESRRVLYPDGIGVVVFAHKSTSGWEAQLQAMIDAGWTMTGSWPIDTERPGRLRAQNSSALASSIHLVCRPRENPDGSIRANDIGDWREVLAELPKRIHEWMPRLAKEGIVGADAIFACLGPALEIYSRYQTVERANGERVTLKEYLEHVWAAVAKEALNIIFEGVDAFGFEEDARLTAMWLWTLTTNENGNNGNGEEEGDEEESGAASKKMTGFTLEYDTARKLSQGLGAHLEELITIVEVKGDKARLFPVEERRRFLFSDQGSKSQPAKRKKAAQQKLFEELEEEFVAQEYDLKFERAGTTVLNQVHQAMLLFSAGKTVALKRFLVEEGMGSSDKFWKLAQALNALYPKESNERRWVEGVQTFKKTLGF